MRSFAPKGQLTAIIDDWSNYYVKRTQDVLDGSWSSHSIWWGMKEGLVAMAPYGEAVPENVAAEADAIQKGIIDGSLHPFTGPIMDQSRRGQGRRRRDHERRGAPQMDWYVQGVEATTTGVWTDLRRALRGPTRGGAASGLPREFASRALSRLGLRR